MSPLTMGLVVALAVLPESQAAIGPQGPETGNWARVDVLRPATPVRVTLATGERRECRFVRSATDDLTLDCGEGAEETLPKSLVVRVTGITRIVDPTGNGTAIGAVLGALTGLAVVGGMYAACGAGCEAPSAGGPVALSLTVGGGAGAAVGWAVDRSRTGEELLFERKTGT